VSFAPPVSSSASILVVDDDRRVVELLTIALTAYGFRVLQAADGDEAVRVALRERPDLVVLDVRLPRKSGFEVCEVLRQDPEDPHVPIIMVSAAAETESRLQGLSRGADDYVAKPFSPKELIARIKRLLARASESREARRRGLAAEHELAHAREDARRSHAELKGEQRLRELTHVFVREFHGRLDVEGVASRLLIAAQTHFGTGMTAMLGAVSPAGPLRVIAVRGELFERLAGVEIRAESELVVLLQGLGRPVRLRELDRFPGLHGELGSIDAAGFTVLAPLRATAGLEGVLALDERVNGRDLEPPDLDLLTVLCETAALALHNARRCRRHAEGLLDMLASMAARESGPAEREARDEAARWVESAAPTVSPRERALVVRAVAFGSWAHTSEGRHALLVTAERDPSGWCATTLRLIDRAGDDRGWADDLPADERRAAGLLAAVQEYVAARLRGVAPAAAATRALECVGERLDEAVRAALSGPPPPVRDAEGRTARNSDLSTSP